MLQLHNESYSIINGLSAQRRQVVVPHSSLKGKDFISSIGQLIICLYIIFIHVHCLLFWLFSFYVFWGENGLLSFFFFFLKKIQHFVKIFKLIREMPMFWNLIFGQSSYNKLKIKKKKKNSRALLWCFKDLIVAFWNSSSMNSSSMQ